MKKGKKNGKQQKMKQKMNQEGKRRKQEENQLKNWIEISQAKLKEIKIFCRIDCFISSQLNR